MLEHYHAGKISKEKIVEKMCHAPSELFRIKQRGYLDEGNFADLVLVDPNQKFEVVKEDLLYKCKWSPLEGYTLPGKIHQVFVNGDLKFKDGRIVNQKPGMRLLFDAS